LFGAYLTTTPGPAVEGRRLEPFSPETIDEGQFLRIAGFSYQLQRSRES
jgi:hypothetical protein